jgi:glycosyltransferase involved in cell wall biosynthesis
MSKIKILVVPSDRTGVGKFRSLDPHIALQKEFGDEFHVDVEYDAPLDNINFYKDYHIVHFHRTMHGDYDKGRDLVEKLNREGIVTVMDIDDYWLPGIEHPIHHIVVENKVHTRIMNNIKTAKYVTTTTSLYAHEISKLNKNVVVFPNAINPNESQFKAVTEPSDKVRIGWLGGSSHYHDLTILDGLFNRMTELKDKSQVFLCGFDTRGTVTEINKATGEQKRRKMEPHETIWAKYEEIFTNKYKLISPEYHKELLKFTQDIDKKYEGEFYQRLWTQPISSYAKNYAKFDVSLAPLKNHMFNKMKSQLKVIEAGFYKKAVVASDLGPYTIDLKHAFKGGDFTDGNAVLIEERKNHKDWYKYVKKLIENPNLVKDLGERLYETVKDTYDLNKVTKDRAEFYKSIV